MLMNSQPCDPTVHEAAVKMARECRFIVQACLRPEEFLEADREFYAIIRQGLENLLKIDSVASKSGQQPHAARALWRVSVVSARPSP
jgi:hypothetical protein